MNGIESAIVSGAQGRAPAGPGRTYRGNLFLGFTVNEPLFEERLVAVACDRNLTPTASP